MSEAKTLELKTFYRRMEVTNQICLRNEEEILYVHANAAQHMKTMESSLNMMYSSSDRLYHLQKNRYVNN